MSARRTSRPGRLKPLAGELQDDGASAVEYGLIVVAIAVVCLGALLGLGRAVQATFALVNSPPAWVGGGQGGVAPPPEPPSDPSTPPATTAPEQTCEAAPCD